MIDPRVKSQARAENNGSIALKNENNLCYLEGEQKKVLRRFTSYCKSY